MFEGLPPEALVGLGFLLFIGVAFLAIKFFARIWLYLLLLSPSLGFSTYRIATEASKNGIENALTNNWQNLLFILAPVDALVANQTLSLYAIALLAIWLWVLIFSSKNLLDGWLIPIIPLIFWVLGKGLPNTMQKINFMLPEWLKWLTLHQGLPLIIILCITLTLLTLLHKRRKTYEF